MKVQQDIKDFHMRKNLITIEESFINRHYITELFKYVLWWEVWYEFMKKHFSWDVILGLKKTNSWISSEYYFYKDEYSIEKAISKFNYKLDMMIPKMNYYWFTFELIPDTHQISELNICDLDKAYIVEGNNLLRKNLYYFYPKSEINKIVSCLKNTIYPLSLNDISYLIKWIKYQDNLWEFVIGKKKKSETIYLTRINFKGFLLFCKEYEWNDTLKEYIIEYKEALKDYVFDIWIEYFYKDGSLKIEKTSIYSLL
jgi:hypothetical protein